MNNLSRGSNANSLCRWSACLGLGVVFFVLLVNAGPLFAAGPPDLVVTDVSISPPNPTPGDEVTVSVRVYNRGLSETRTFFVRLYVNDERQEHKRVAFGLDAGEKDTVEFGWVAQPGSNELKAVADDPFDKVVESNEDNNSRTIVVNVSQPAVGTAATDLRIVVVSFTDKSNSSFANVSGGLADMLTEKLVNNGFNVLERQEIESILFERQLNPLSNADLVQASLLAGADGLVAGSITGIDVQKSRLNLGFLSVTGATVRVSMAYRLISSYTGEILTADSVSAKAEGQTDASFNIGILVNSATQVSSNVCSGGLMTNKNLYGVGEVITVGYLDNNPSSTFTVQFFDSGGFAVRPPMFYKTTTSSNPCVTWNWNPSPALTPGNYSARLYDTFFNLVSTKNFSVTSGPTPPVWVNNITFGTTEFAHSVVGEAVEKALSTTASNLAGSLNNSAPTLLDQRTQYSEGMDEEEEEEEPDEEEVLELKCHVVSLAGSDSVILAGVDGNCGRLEGVQVDDIFYLYSAQSVRDPNTNQLIEIIPKTEQPKGRVIVTDIYEKASRAQMIGSFTVEVGDLAILK